MMLDFGFMYALGTLFIPLLAKFQETRAKIAGIQSTFNGVSFISSAMTGLFVSRWGPYNGILASSILIPAGFFLSFFANSMFYLYLSLGVIAGLGNSFVYVSCAMAVGQNIPHSQRPLALSFQMAMMGAAGVLYPYLLDWLLSLYDINGVFLICSALFLHTIISVIVFRYEIQMKREKTQTPRDDDKYKQKTKNAYVERNNNIVTDIVTRSTENQGCSLGLFSVRFCLFVVASAMVNSNASGFITVAQDIFTERTLSNSQILSSFMTFNICNSISRLGPAVSSKLKISCFAVSFLASVFGFSGQILIMLSHSFIPAVVGSGLTGAALGSMSSTASTATFELFGPNRQAVGLGIMATIDGIAVTAIGPLFGFIRDTNGAYTSVLYLTISLNLGGFLLLVIILVLECRSTQKRLEIPRRNQTPSIASFLSQTTKY